MVSLGRAVYCEGGPLAGQGFTDNDWQRRTEAARNMGSGAALGYRPTDLPPPLNPKVAETLGGYTMTWMRWAPTPDETISRGTR